MSKLKKFEAVTESMGGERPCGHCQPQVKLTMGSLAEILGDYLREHDEGIADETTYAARLAECKKCPDLLDGCTCRHCACLVQVRAKLAGKGCPSPAGAKW
jgi:hypothetical protein